MIDIAHWPGWATMLVNVALVLLLVAWLAVVFWMLAGDKWRKREKKRGDTPKGGAL